MGLVITKSGKDARQFVTRDYCSIMQKAVTRSLSIGEEFAVSRHSDLDNHANQLNPNNDAYWESRGWDGRPDDWEDDR